MLVCIPQGGDTIACLLVRAPTFTRLCDAIAVTLFPGEPRGDKYRMCVADRQIRRNSLCFTV